MRIYDAPINAKATSEFPIFYQKSLYIFAESAVLTVLEMLKTNYLREFPLSK